MEHFSKYILLVPLTDKHAARTYQIFEYYMLGRYRGSAKAVTDQGGEWKREWLRSPVGGCSYESSAKVSQPPSGQKLGRAHSAEVQERTKMYHLNSWEWEEESCYTCSEQTATTTGDYTSPPPKVQRKVT